MTHAQEMMTLLEEEFSILTRGDFAALPDLVDRKERLDREMRDGPVQDSVMLEALATAAARNAALIDAARRGIEQARVQIREIRAGMTQATYGRTGDRKPLTRTPSRIEQKF